MQSYQTQADECDKQCSQLTPVKYKTSATLASAFKLKQYDSDKMEVLINFFVKINVQSVRLSLFFKWEARFSNLVREEYIDMAYLNMM